MNLITIAPAIMAGIVFFVGLYHILVYSRLRQQRYNLTFALTCLIIGFYDVLCAGFYNATSVFEGQLWTRAQVATMHVAAIALMFFIIDYTKYQPRKLPYIFAIYFVSQAVLSLLNPWNLLLDPAQPSISVIGIPGLPEVTYYEAAPGPLSAIQGLMAIAIFMYFARIIFFYYKQGHRVEGRNLVVVLALFFAGVFNDSMVLNDVYQFYFLFEYTYIFIILFMTIQISRTVIETGRLEAALHDSEERYRHIVEGMSDGLGVLDEIARITFVNDHLCKMFGLNQEDLLGHRITEFLDSENRHVFMREREQLLAGEQESFELEWTGAAERKIHTIVSPAIICDKEGHPQGSVAVITDISDRKRAEDALKKLYDETLQVSEMKSNLITFASHELKTPLVPIVGWAELVKNAIDRGQDLNSVLGGEAIDSLSRAAARLSRLVSNFLDVGRLERESMELQREPFSVGMLLDNAIKELDHAARTNSIEINNLAQDATLSIDGFRIEEVFINVLGNAIKYSPSGTEVDVFSESDADAGLYYVYFCDQGYGFTPEELEDVWHPFSRVYLRKKDTNPSGTGVGLYLSKGIVERHGGQIEISSPGPNLGSTIKITLPMTPIEDKK